MGSVPRVQSGLDLILHPRRILSTPVRARARIRGPGAWDSNAPRLRQPRGLATGGRGLGPMGREGGRAMGGDTTGGGLDGGRAGGRGLGGGGGRQPQPGPYGRG